MREIVSSFLKKGYLLNPNTLKNLKDEDFKEFFSLANKKIKSKENLLVFNEDLFNLVKSDEKKLDTNWIEFEKARSLAEKGKDVKVYNTFLDIMNYNVSEAKRDQLNKLMRDIKEPDEKVEIEESGHEEISVTVLNTYSEEAKKREVKDFVSYFRARYEGLKKILRMRPEMQNATSINRILTKPDREQVTTIGIVSEKRTTKNGNIILMIEDPTGTINILINKNRDIFDVAQDVVLDEVVGVSGVTGNRIIFANNLIHPGVPLGHENKKAKSEVYAAFISDIHIGSKMFMKEEFEKFIKWINGETGNAKQKDLALKVKYLFIAGDLVDGIGIYPEQDSELDVKDIKQQYDLLSTYLSKIRKDIRMIAIPGNHDAQRLALPQPGLHEEYSKSILDLKNITILSNPGYVNIHSSQNFPGFNVLIYHGNSFHYYGDNVDSLRLGDANANPTKITRYLLKKRHLSPVHEASRYVPDNKKDSLIIDTIPDIVVTGDLHRSGIDNYNNVLLIACSCWQGRTKYQEKLGSKSDHAKVPLLNLKTKEISIMKFGK